MKVEEIELKKILRDKNNPRKTVEEIEQLANSIEMNGQLVPIDVEDLGNGTYLVDNGHRRYDATTRLQKRLKKKLTMRCLVNQKLTADERLMKQIVLDIQHKNWDLLARDVAWENLWKTKKWTRKEFTKRIGASDGLIVDFFDRREIDPEIKKMLNSKKINPTILTETKTLKGDARKKVIKFAQKTGQGSHRLRVISKGLRDAPEDLVDAFTNEDISLDQVKQMKSLSEEKREASINVIKHMNKQVKSVPTLVKKGEIKQKTAPPEKINAQQFMDKLNDMIGEASSQMVSVEGILDRIEDEKWDDYFTPEIKLGLAGVLEELKDTIQPTTDRIDKTLEKWRK